MTKKCDWKRVLDECYTVEVVIPTKKGNVTAYLYGHQEDVGEAIDLLHKAIAQGQTKPRNIAINAGPLVVSHKDTKLQHNEGCAAGIQRKLEDK